MGCVCVRVSVFSALAKEGSSPRTPQILNDCWLKHVNHYSQKKAFVLKMITIYIV